MAKRIFQVANFTFTATSDSTTTFTSGTYMAIRGATTTQKIDVLEVLISGMAAASTPMPIQLARSGLLAATTTLLAAPNSDGPMDPATAALLSPPLTFIAAASNGGRSSSTADARLNLGLNVFGGIIRWNAAPTQQWTITGNTAPGGETYLSCFQQGLSAGVANAHIVYEPY